MSLISAKNITVKRDSTSILEDVSIEVNKGEIVTLIGPNGAGKTMLIKVLLGIEKEYDGDVELDAGTQVGYVPQKVVVSPFMPMSVARFMNLAGGFPAQQIDEALQWVHGCHLAGHLMRTLSGGELQRVLLARALLRKPELLVLDEPAQGMDIGGQITFYEHIKAVADALGCGVLLVSHDLNMVMSASDKVVCIHRHVCCSGVPDAVTQTPEFASMFGEKAVETLALYQHNHNHTHGGWDRSDIQKEGCDHG